MAHVPILISTARDEDLLYASQAREVQGFDVYAHPGKFERAKQELREFLSGAPSDLTKGFELVDDQQGMEVSFFRPHSHPFAHFLAQRSEVAARLINVRMHQQSWGSHTPL